MTKPAQQTLTSNDKASITHSSGGKSSASCQQSVAKKEFGCSGKSQTRHALRVQAGFSPDILRERRDKDVSTPPSPPPTTATHSVTPDLYTGMLAQGMYNYGLLCFGLFLLLSKSCQHLLWIRKCFECSTITLIDWLIHSFMSTA